MNVYADASARKAVEDDLMKKAKAELLKIVTENPGLLDEAGRMDLEKGYLRTAHESKVVAGPKFDFRKLLDVLPTCVKMDFNKVQVKIFMEDADKRRELTKLGVDMKVEDELKVELRKAA